MFSDETGAQLSKPAFVYSSDIYALCMVKSGTLSQPLMSVSYRCISRCFKHNGLIITKCVSSAKQRLHVGVHTHTHKHKTQTHDVFTGIYCVTLPGTFFINKCSV